MKKIAMLLLLSATISEGADHSEWHRYLAPSNIEDRGSAVPADMGDIERQAYSEWSEYTPPSNIEDRGLTVPADVEDIKREAEFADSSFPGAYSSQDQVHMPRSEDRLLQLSVERAKELLRQYSRGIYHQYAATDYSRGSHSGRAAAAAGERHQLSQEELEMANIKNFIKKNNREIERIYQQGLNAFKDMIKLAKTAAEQGVNVDKGIDVIEKSKHSELDSIFKEFDGLMEDEEEY